MSILLTAAFPLALAGAGLPSLAVNATPAAASAHVVAQPAKLVPVKAIGPAPKSAPVSTAVKQDSNVVVGQPALPPLVQQIRIQDPAPAPQATAPAALDRNTVIDRVGRCVSACRD